MKRAVRQMNSQHGSVIYRPIVGISFRKLYIRKGIAIAMWT
ncbi:hypothetical protein H1P_4800004 [Hyella patelloides LEGE 07179]|uniref:Uncharacterized protein n=1 Tax=Hyella patelloides LEGE 07179 TaxID=945734 RepID=A0A563VYZ1_9CYAN|nr:hypothetical protein H1P_4800004 [Hyella patelloides LEGE 07179]